jgi:hypothetical protein
MKLCFDSLDELRSFMAEMDGDGSDDAAEAATGTKGRRGRKPKPVDAAAAGAAQGIAPPPGSPNAPAGFTAPATAPATPAAGFPGTGTTGFAPPTNGAAQLQANPLVAAIIAKTEAAVAAGHPADNVLGWFRQALGPDAAQLNWEQIKAVALPKASEPLLKDIASKMGVQV